jgi:hypothetical protein
MRTLALAIVATMISCAANAADITLEQQNQGMAIAIVGEITTGDYEKFKAMAAKLPAKSFVALDSDGGIILEAIQIGEMVRAKKFRTVAGEVCASACALIWVAGTERGAFDESQIGFHSAYSAITKQISGSANAIIGAYLSRLGYGYPAIHYMTKVGPESMEWLTIAKANQLGIKVTKVTGRHPKRSEPPSSEQTPFVGPKSAPKP